MKHLDPNHSKAPNTVYLVPLALPKPIAAVVSKTLAPKHHPLKQGLINACFLKSIYGLSSLVMTHSDPNHPKAP